mmetsp:Transcript_40425/g.96975  ORF Transcript_40425/g.96975 Transcript_40425/m.96975 type:complete len:374 (+) Transcript_40425:2-1123(+)
MNSDGSLPDVVPQQRFGGRPADLSWNSAFIENVYELVQVGHLAPAQSYWEEIKRNVGFIEGQLSQAGGLGKLPEPYGDWCPPPTEVGKGQGPKPTKGFAAAFSLVRSVQQAAAIGKVIGGAAAQDAVAIRAMAGNLTAQFHSTFYNNRSNSYDNGVMTTYTLPLALGAVPDDLKPQVVAALVSLIDNSNTTWTGGIINNRFLFEVLHENGRGDLALRMLQSKAYPSYGYMYFNDLEPARECMWELPDAPYEGTGMNSRNHHMFSSVGEYLVKRIGGLQVHGDKVMVVAGSHQGSVQVSTKTSRGEVHLTWAQGAFTAVKLRVPVGMKATVLLPAAGQLVGASAPTTLVHGTEYYRVSVGSGEHVIGTGAEVVV